MLLMGKSTINGPFSTAVDIIRGSEDDSNTQEMSNTLLTEIHIPIIPIINKNMLDQAVHLFPKHGDSPTNVDIWMLLGAGYESIC